MPVTAIGAQHTNANTKQDRISSLTVTFVSQIASQINSSSPFC